MLNSQLTKTFTALEVLALPPHTYYILFLIVCVFIVWACAWVV